MSLTSGIHEVTAVVKPIVPAQQQYMHTSMLDKATACLCLNTFNITLFPSPAKKNITLFPNKYYYIEPTFSQYRVPYIRSRRMAQITDLESKMGSSNFI